MTEQQKQRILQLRKQGATFSSIAEELSLSVNTVKSFFRRNIVNSRSTLPICNYCGKPLIQPYGKKEKKYCSDKCRMLWWNAHRSDLKKKTVCTYVCAFCRKEFTSYKSTHRTYCSRDCYYKGRFGGL